MSKFIAVEGVDGAGKTLQTKLLARHLRSLGFSVATVSFPEYRSQVGAVIGAILSEDCTVPRLNPKEMAVLYACDRAAVINTRLRSILGRYDFIISNRFTLSSQVYQSIMAKQRSLGLWVDRLEHELLCIPRPDLYLVLDTPVSFAARHNVSKRRRRYIDGIDVYERNSQTQRLARSYYIRSAKQNKNAVLIKCSISTRLLSPATIHEEIFNALKQRRFV